MTEDVKRIAECIVKMSGKYSVREIFSDWVQCLAISIQNACTLHHGQIWKEREDQYCAIMKKYGEDTSKFCGLTDQLTDAMENDIADILGEIYMKSDQGNKGTGQFFTPFHLSGLTSRIAIAGTSGNDVINISEPSCGSGGMIIAAAKELRRKGIDYQRRMKVVAQDIEWTSVYMTYVQLSLYGINAVVIQGNTLAEPYRKGTTPERNVLYTPMASGIFL